MAKVKKIIGFFWGMLIGNILSFMLLLRYSSNLNNSCLVPVGIDNAKYIEKKSDINLILVGVMTAPIYFDSRAKAVYQTWGRDIPGDIKFYSSQNSHSSEIPLIALKDVDDSYPPQKKSLMMLKHMHDNYLNDFEWFMRADDDVYIRPDRLEELLRSVDSKKTWFIGQTGRGNSEEFGLLSLDSDENFCMGGPGVILSRETLKRVAPFVDDCLQHLYTSHEDVELGRCVRKFAGVSCTWSYQMQVIFYHNQSGYSAFTGSLKQKEIHQAITLHPVKHPEHLYRLHNYFKNLKIRSNCHDALNLQRDLVRSWTTLNHQKPSTDKITIANDTLIDQKEEHLNILLGVPASVTTYTAKTLENIYEWDFLSGSLYSSGDLNPKRRISSTSKEGLADTVAEVMELINYYSKQRGRVIEFKEVIYGYFRLHPLHGVEYILDLLLVYRKYRGHKMTIHVRRHAYVQQIFLALYIREIGAFTPIIENGPKKSIPVHKQIKHALLHLQRNLQPFFEFSENNEKEAVHFILPLSGRFEIFERFMRIYEKVCLIPREYTSLIIILYEYQDSPGDIDDTMNLVEFLKNKYYDSKISITHKTELFSRGRALNYGVDNLKDDDLIFFVDVDMIFNDETLKRIRTNTILNKSVYFPIVFSSYNLKIYNRSISIEPQSIDSTYLINEESGFWRQFGFGIVSLYKSDYLGIGGFNLMITGWGFEDVTFYDKVIKSNLHVQRSVDPSLIHIYHKIHCDENLDTTQKNMCLGSETSVLGSLKNLQNIYVNHKILFQ